MKKSTILGILFFGSVWGVSEVALGEPLYAAHFRYASVPLCIIAIVILTFARSYFPQRGVATLIACCAAAYKSAAMFSSFVGSPFFACHLLGIVALGAAYDLVFSAFPRLNKSVCAGGASYLGYALFAFPITYVFRYGQWPAGGLSKILGYVGIEGTMVAIAAAALVPASFHVAARLRQKAANPFAFGPRPAVRGISTVTVALWMVAVGVSLLTWT